MIRRLWLYDVAPITKDRDSKHQILFPPPQDVNFPEITYDSHKHSGLPVIPFPLGPFTRSTKSYPPTLKRD